MITITDSFASAGRNLGNKLFTYALGRILSENLNLNLKIPDNSVIKRGSVVEEFPFYGIYNKISITDPVVYVSDSSLYELGLPNLIASSQNSGIFLDGYFLKYNYIKDYKNTIKSIYSKLIETASVDNDVVIMLRNSNIDHTFALPDSYYLDILSKLNFDNLYISFDHYDKHKKLIEELKTKHNVILLDLNIIELIKKITSFRTIIACQGTFSFWASFLSHAKTIYWPLTTIGPNKNSDPNVNLTVDDEDRYVFISI